MVAHMARVRFLCQAKISLIHVIADAAKEPEATERSQQILIGQRNPATSL